MTAHLFKEWMSDGTNGRIEVQSEGGVRAKSAQQHSPLIETDSGNYLAFMA